MDGDLSIALDRERRHSRRLETRAVFDEQARKAAISVIKKMAGWIRTGRQPKGFALCDAHNAIAALREYGL